MAGYHVTAKYVDLGEQDLPNFPDITDRSNLFRLLDNMFRPPSVKVKQTDADFILNDRGQHLNLPVN